MDVKTIKASTQECLVIDLKNKLKAVFIANNETWNGLKEYRCTNIESLRYSKLIVIEESNNKLYNNHHKLIFDNKRTSLSIILASPELLDLLECKDIENEQGLINN